MSTSRSRKNYWYANHNPFKSRYNCQNWWRRPASSGENAQRPPGRPPGARRGLRPLGRPAAPARSADRASPPHPGPLRPSVGAAPRGARPRDEARADRGLRGRDLLFAFRRREGWPATARRDGAGVRQPVLRDGRRRDAARPAPGDPRQGRARRARALHGRLRSRAGLPPSATCRRSTRRPRRSRPPRRRSRMRMPTSPAPISPPTAGTAAMRC